MGPVRYEQHGQRRAGKAEDPARADPLSTDENAANTVLERRARVHQTGPNPTGHARFTLSPSGTLGEFRDGLGPHTRRRWQQ